MRVISFTRNRKQKWAIQEITNEKAPDAPEEVKGGNNTMLIVPVIIGILVVIGIILLIIRIRRSKR